MKFLFTILFTLAFKLILVAQSDYLEMDNLKVRIFANYKNCKEISVDNLVEKLYSLDFVKKVEINSDSTIIIDYDNDLVLLPNKIISIFQSNFSRLPNLIFNLPDESELLSYFKTGNVEFKKFYISDMFSQFDLKSLEKSLLTDPNFLCIDFNFKTHQLLVIHTKELSIGFIKNQIEKTGKLVIKNKEELEDYYKSSKK